MYFTLNLTKNCNLDCKYCQDKKANIKMSAKVALNALKLSATTKYSGFSFFGGEPLLEEDLIRLIVTEAKKYKENIFSFNITTNGTLLTEEFLQFAKENKIEISLSHDGIAQDDNRYYKDGSKTTDILDDKIDLLLRYQKTANAMLTYTKETVTKLAQSVEWLYNKGFETVITTMDCRGGQWDKVSINKMEKEYEIISKFLIDKYQQGIKLSFPEFDNKIYENINKKRKCDNCKLGKKQPSIDVDGNIYPCVQFVGLNEYIMGDVFKGIDIKKQQDIYQKSKKKINKECKECKLYRRCRNNCACLNFVQTNDMNKVSDEQCIHEQFVIMNADYMASILYKENNLTFMKKFYN